jgi:trk system potassium uptake protein TrkA
MKIIVVGCGRLGSDLAYKMYKKGHDVCVIDRSSANFSNLPPDFVGITLEDDVLALDVLRRAGIEKAQALAAVTNSDAINAVVGRVAISVFDVPNVVVRVFDPGWQALHEALNLPLINSVSWSSQQIEDMFSGAPVRSVSLSFDGNTCIFEMVVPEAWKGSSLVAVLPEHADKILAVIRSEQIMAASQKLRLEPGDRIYLYTDNENIEALRNSYVVRGEG